MKTSLWLGLAAAFALAGCGGGGSGNAGATSPTYTYATLATLTSPTTFATVGDDYYFTNSNSSNATVSTATVTASYDPSSMDYTLSATPAGSTTTVTQVFPPSGSTGRYNISTPEADGSTRNSYLTLTQQLATQSSSGAAPDTIYTYTGLGAWALSVDNGIFIENENVYYFSYGVATQQGDLPRTGTATYTLELEGLTGNYAVFGAGTLTVNFSAGTATLSLSPAVESDTHFSDAPLTSIGPLTGTGTINSTNNSFSVSVTSQGLNGTVNGLFYGPQGAEIGAAFTITLTGGGIPIAGGALGKK